MLPATHAWRHSPFKQCWPVPHSASCTHDVEGASSQKLDALQVCPVGQGDVAPHAARHSLFTHTRPAPHWLLNWQVFVRAVHV